MYTIKLFKYMLAVAHTAMHEVQPMNHFFTISGNSEVFALELQGINHDENI